jgi:hypothetical protein
VPRIGEQIDREPKLLAEALVRRDVVFTHSNDRNIRVVEILFACGERLALDRAARRVVFRIDVDDQPLAFEVVERDCLAVLVLESEIDEALASSTAMSPFPPSV